MLVGEMPRYLPVAFVPNEDLCRGRLVGALDGVRALAFPPPPRLDGAPVVAARLLAEL